ncbi:MAG: TIM barrel protein [Bryobacterales bacterium]|nr:TIM barrel protein [Bryobacterales bacterium]
MDRRTLLAAGSSLLTLAQQPPPVMAPPKKATITSSVMLWTLKGSFEERMEAAARAGLQSVEFVGEHYEWSDADIERVKRLARSLKLGIDTLSSVPRWGQQKLNMLQPEGRDAFLKEVERNLVFAQKLEIPMALLMSGNTVAGLSFEQQFAAMVECSKRCGDIAAKYGITLIVEPLNAKVSHKGYFLTNCVDGLRLMQETNHPHVRLLFDLFHEQVERGNVIQTALAAMPYVKVFHVADNPGRHEPGTGEMNYANIYKAIAKAGYEGYITMEYVPLQEQVGSLQKAVTEMRAALAG